MSELFISSESFSIFILLVVTGCIIRDIVYFIKSKGSYYTQWLVTYSLILFSVYTYFFYTEGMFIAMGISIINLVLTFALVRLKSNLDTERAKEEQLGDG